MKRTFIGVPLRSLLMCWLCVALLSFALLGSLETGNLGRQENAYHQRLQETFSNIFTKVSSRFEYAVSSAQSIATNRWYSHLLNIADLYKEEFSAINCAEYAKQFSRQLLSLDFVNDILLIVPQNDVIVSRRGWLTLNTYKVTYGNEIEVHASAGENIAPEITLHNENLFSYHVQNPEKRAKQSCIYILFDKSALAKYMEAMLPQESVSGQLVFGSSTVWETGAHSENVLSFTDAASYPNFTLTLNMQPYFEVYRSDLIYRLITEGLILLFASFILALLITKLAWMPISRAFTHEKASSKPLPKNPLEAIDTVLTDNKALTSRNAEISRYIADLQSEILYGILSNPGSNVGNTSVLESIPWLAENKPYLMTIMKGDAENFSSCAAHRISVILPDGICLCLWYNNEEEAENEKQTLCQLDDAPCISNVETDCTRMQKIFAALYEEFRIEYLIQHELPLEILYEFYGDMIAGKEKECMDLISNMRLHCTPDAILHHVARFARENGASYDTLNATWESIEECVCEICRLISDSHLVSSCHSAAALCEYIDENFTNPDMSIKLLCEEFNIGRTLISQLIKTQTGETFTDYLTGLRMSKACELLLQEDSVTAVGEKIGYLNYSTFKRAFMRKFEISPRQWRDGHSGQIPAE